MWLVRSGALQVASLSFLAFCLAGTGTNLLTDRGLSLNTLTIVNSDGGTKAERQSMDLPSRTPETSNVFPSWVVRVHMSCGAIAGKTEIPLVNHVDKQKPDNGMGLGRLAFCRSDSTRSGAGHQGLFILHACIVFLHIVIQCAAI